MYINDLTPLLRHVYFLNAIVINLGILMKLNSGKYYF